MSTEEAVGRWGLLEAPEHDIPSLSTSATYGGLPTFPMALRNLTVPAGTIITVGHRTNFRSNSGKCRPF